MSKTHKTLYGLLRSALIFCKKLVEDLEQYGIVLNPYNPCVENKMVGGSQMIVPWHVSDLKVFHKNTVDVIKFACYLQSIYGDNLTIKCGNVHDYLWIDLGFF